jgi:hypothetical protein
MMLRPDAVLEDYEYDQGFVNLMYEHDLQQERLMRFKMYIFLGSNLALTLSALIVIIAVKVGLVRLRREHREFLRRLLV